MRVRSSHYAWRSQVIIATPINSLDETAHRHLPRVRPIISRLVILLCLFGLGLFAGAPAPHLNAQSLASATVEEQPVTLIPIAGAVSRLKTQLSGLAWYGDTLILLPQYPAEYQNHLFYLTKQQIIDTLAGVNTEPLRAGVVPLFGVEALEQLEGFEGFESIDFVGERAYLTVETDLPDGMLSFVTTGLMMPDLSGLRIYPTFRSEITPQTGIANLGDEALLVVGDKVLTFYELNGMFFNTKPVAHIFDGDDLLPVGTMPMPLLDYRLTDATALDADNRFWVSNYFFPDDLIKLSLNSLAPGSGRGQAFIQNGTVERLVQMEYTPTGIKLVDRPPIKLKLTDAKGRNWEGIARLETPEFSGFLLVTDGKPMTLLGFVADPAE